MSSSILYYVKNAGKPIKFVPPDYAYDIPYIESLVNKGGRIISEKQTGSDCWWFEFGGLQNTISDAQEIGLELKKLVMGVWDYIKNSGRYPDAENYTLEWIGNIPGKRESRRMITDYILKQDDIVEQRSFHDTAFYGGWYMDFHPAEGLESGEENCVQIPVQIYEIPFRCLYYSRGSQSDICGKDYWHGARGICIDQNNGYMCIIRSSCSGTCVPVPDSRKNTFKTYGKTYRRTTEYADEGGYVSPGISL